MKTITIRRKANVSRARAMQEILKAHPEADVLSLIKRGSTYVASLRVTAEDEGGDVGGESEAPAKKEKAPAPSSEGSDEGGDDDGDSDDGGEGPDLGGDEGGPGDDMMGMKPKAPSADESLASIVHLLTQLVHTMGAGAGGGHPGGMPPAPPHAGPPAPPGPGGPPGAGGPPGGHPGAPPMPPPAVKHGPGGMGGPAFASYRTFVAKRADAHEVTDQEAISEAVREYPGYRVAKLQRDREQNIIALALVKKA